MWLDYNWKTSTYCLTSNSICLCKVQHLALHSTTKRFISSAPARHLSEAIYASGFHRQALTNTNHLYSLCVPMCIIYLCGCTYVFNLTKSFENEFYSTDSFRLESRSTLFIFIYLVLHLFRLFSGNRTVLEFIFALPNKN